MLFQAIHHCSYLTRGLGPRHCTRAPRPLLLLLLLAVLSACTSEKTDSDQPADRPNILLFIADDWSYPHAGVYGDRTVKTPNFDALAAGGMLFTNAYCAAPSCSPSRAAILTGRYPHQNGVAGNLWSEFPAELKTYPNLLAAEGYATGYEQKGWAPGDWRASRDQDPTGERRDGITQFLNVLDADQPFCYWFGTSDPHRVYHRNLGALMGMKADSVEVPPFLPDLPCVRNDLLDYYAEVERLDRHLGQVVDLLRSRGRLDNTLIVVTSDNGMPFPRAKATVYDAGARMPFVAHWPARIPAGGTSDAFVNLASLAPTFMEAAALRVPPEMTLPSLLPLLCRPDDEPPAFREVLIERERHAQVRADSGSYAVRALRNDDFLYVRNYYPERWPAGDPVAVRSVGAYGDVDNSITKMLMLAGVRSPNDTTDLRRLAFGKRPEEELYDLREDPAQLHNLAADSAYAPTLSEHRDRLTARLLETNDPRATDPRTSFWDETRYTPAYGTRTYDRDAYVADYRYYEVHNGTHFRELPCLPVED